MFNVKKRLHDSQAGQLKTQKSCNLLPTCQGYSLAPVSTPPTILVTLLAWPQLHVAVVVAVVVVMGPVVVVVIGDVVDVGGVVVVGAEHFRKYNNKISKTSH